MDIVKKNRDIREALQDDDVKLTDLYMSELEYAKILATRAKQLESGEEPLVKLDNVYNTIDIAREELYKGVIPLMIERKLPNGSIEYLDPFNMIIPL